MSSIYPIPGFAEPASCWTHLASAVVFLFLSIPLVRRWGTSKGRTISLVLFAFSVVFLLSMSGVYHLLPRGGVGRMVFQRLDHAAIFVLIAGTFSVVHSINFSGFRRWGSIALAWAITATVIPLKMVYFSDIPFTASVLVYLALGWLGVFSGISLWRMYGLRYVRPLVYGGIAYTFGALLELVDQPVLISGVIGPHELFHVAVILGISFHWYFICSSLEKHAPAWPTPQATAR